MNDGWKGKLRSHLFWEYPKEACGLLLDVNGEHVYHPCRNQALDDEHFVMHPQDYAAAEDKGQIIMILHTHPSTPAEPSMADKVGCEKSGLPWGIMDRTGKFTSIVHEGYKAPLIGRPYVYGLLDCYALVRDYYKERLGVELKDEPRFGHWWERGENRFIDRFQEYGFYSVEKPEAHDLILMRIRSSVPNHLGIYLGDGDMIHHPLNALSVQTIFRYEWQRILVGFLRYAGC